MIKVANRPDDYRGDRIIVYGEIVERGPDFFLARTGAERRSPSEPADSGPGEYRRRRPSTLLAERRSVRRWRILAKCGVGPGLAWQQGLWRDELRPASEQLVGLFEGDIFKAFVQVVGTEFQEDRSGGRVAIPSLVIDRIIVYASSAIRPVVIDLGARGLSPSRPPDGDVALPEGHDPRARG